RSDWTAGFQTGGSGALAAGDTITIVINSGFTVPAVPAVTLLSGFANCSASATATGTTATVTLSNSAGTCALAKNTAATLLLSRLTNPAAGTLTGTTFSVATSKETVVANPANVVIAAATQTSAPTFTGTPQSGAARSTWAVGFTTSATGALTTG